LEPVSLLYCRTTYVRRVCRVQVRIEILSF